MSVSHILRKGGGGTEKGGEWDGDIFFFFSHINTSINQYGNRDLLTHETI